MDISIYRPQYHSRNKPHHFCLVSIFLMEAKKLPLETCCSNHRNWLCSYRSAFNCSGIFGKRFAIKITCLMNAFMSKTFLKLHGKPRIFFTKNALLLNKLKGNMLIANPSGDSVRENNCSVFGPFNTNFVILK